MAAEKEGGDLSRRKGSAGRGGSARTGRTAEKAGPDGTVADVDPWSSFFEMFWGSEGESTDRDEGGRQPVKGTRKTSASASGRGACCRSSCRTLSAQIGNVGPVTEGAPWRCSK